MSSSLPDTLNALDIMHSPEVPLPHLSAHLVTTAGQPLDVLARQLDADDPARRAALWLGGPETLPAWRAQMEFATPLSSSSREHVHALTALLTSQRVAIADVVEGMELPSPPPTLREHPSPDPEFLRHHKTEMYKGEMHASLMHAAPQLLLALSPDAHPESLLPMLGFGGTDTNPPIEEHLAILAYWQSLWGARLVACGPQRLELLVLRRPASWRDAFELAQEHLDYCPMLTHDTPHTIKTRATMLREHNLWTFDWS